MLRPGRIPLTPAEHDAVDDLIGKHPEEPVSLTRRDPGNTGPLLVHVGVMTYEVDEQGRARKRRRRAG